MSNVVTAGGLRLYKGIDGMGQSLEVVFIPASDGTLLGIGDAVTLTGAGGSIGQGPLVQTVTRTTAATGIIDYVIEGFLPHFSDGTGNMNFTIVYRPASTAMYALARPANNKDVYVITDDASAVVGSANIGKNANLVVTNASTATGLSNMQLNATTVATTSTFQLKIVGFVDDIRNDATSTSARVLVVLNNVRRSNQVAGV